MKLIERFMDKVVQVPIAGCWIWTASHIESVGYGRFGMSSGEVEYAHRASWRLFRGEIPKGMYVCHHCDVRLCVNPDHLFLGTASDNMRDASRKNRVVLPTMEQRLRGEKQPMSKLTNDQVRRIRASEVSSAALAKEFGVDPSAISRIRSRQTYASVQ